MEKKLSIGLFEPGMSRLHRVGLAGLYMSLRYFDNLGKTFSGARWELQKDRVILYWQGNDKDFLDSLFKASFGFDNNGIIDFAAHRTLPAGDMEGIFLNELLLLTFLQHNKQNKIPKNSSKTVNVQFDEKQLAISFKPFNSSYAHTDAANSMVDKKGSLLSNIRIKGWLYPGAVKRHESAAGSEIEEPPEMSIALLYAPVASLYYRLAHKGKDGKYDQRRSAAVVLPHIYDMELYSRSFQHYLKKPVARLYADSISDAGLAALIALKAGDHADQLGVDGCSVLTMGTVGWAKQQKTRVNITSIDNCEEDKLDLFDICLNCLPNKTIIKSRGGTEEKDSVLGAAYYVVPSLSRGVMADNIASGRNWFNGFWELMSSKEQAKIIVSYEKRGLNEMTKENVWAVETDRTLVEALHLAIRRRYGALASRTKPGERIPFDREFERMRTGLMRCKNAQTLRAELADFFARGGINHTLQENWRELLPLLSGGDWQRARDLALFALASYSGEGADEVVDTAEIDINEMEG